MFFFELKSIFLKLGSVQSFLISTVKINNFNNKNVQINQNDIKPNEEI